MIPKLALKYIEVQLRKGVNPGGLLLNMSRISYAMKSYVQTFVIGPQGTGKTRYSMLTMYRLYGDWDMVLHYTYFDPARFIEDHDRALNENRQIPFILFDDAGLYFSKYLWFQGKTERAYTILLNSIFNTIRTITNTVVFTSPDDDILVEMRKKSWVMASVDFPKSVNSALVHDIFANIPPEKLMHSTNFLFSNPALRKREVTLYERRQQAWNPQKYVTKKLAKDAFDIGGIPDDVWSEYERRRKKAMKKILEELKALREKLEEQEVEKDLSKYNPHTKAIVVANMLLHGKKINIPTTIGMTEMEFLTTIGRHNQNVQTYGQCPYCQVDWLARKKIDPSKVKEVM